MQQVIAQVRLNYLKIISTIDAAELKDVFNVLSERKQATLDDLEDAIQHRNLMQAKVDRAFDEEKFDKERSLNTEYLKAAMKVGNLNLRSTYYDAFVKELAIRLEKDFEGPKL